MLSRKTCATINCSFHKEARYGAKLQVQSVTMTRSISVRDGLVGQGREPLVCTPLVGRTHAAILAELRSIAGKAPDLIEWRADFFSDLADCDAVLRIAQELRAGAAGIPVIFTIRSAAEGGEAIAISDQQVSAIQQTLCVASAVELIDLEMGANPKHLELLRTAAKTSDTQLILSYHNFRETPDAAAIYAKFALAQELGAAIAKVAVMPKTPEDVLTLLSATYKAHLALHIPLISISMGDYGVLTRLFGWVFGSAVTFAVGEANSAPGQVPIEELRATLQILKRALAKKSHQ